MILLEVKQYIHQHGQVSAEHLKNHFDLTADALEGIMQPLIDQGHVQMITAGGQCSSGACGSGCQANSGASFYWVDRRLKPIHLPVDTP